MVHQRSTRSNRVAPARTSPASRAKSAVARSTLMASLVIASSRARGTRTDRRPVAVTAVAGPPGRTQMSTKGGPSPCGHSAVSAGARTRWSATVSGEAP